MNEYKRYVKYFLYANAFTQIYICNNFGFLLDLFFYSDEVTIKHMKKYNKSYIKNYYIKTPQSDYASIYAKVNTSVDVKMRYMHGSFSTGLSTEV